MITRGTTPTIRYTFENVDTSQITQAILTIKTPDGIDEYNATIGEQTAEVKLTQEQTLALPVGTIAIMLNWLLTDGTRGASEEGKIAVLDNHKNEVMP